MKDIYKNADRVVIWLGNGDQSAEKGVEYLSNFSEEGMRGWAAGFGPTSSVP
jgi:hypothetical protein